MAYFDTVVRKSANWRGGYKGNAPTSEEEYNVLVEMYPDMWDGGPLTWTEIQSGIVNLACVENREHEYPPIGDQLDDLFHRSLFSEEMTEKLQAVKDKYPKG